MMTASDITGGRAKYLGALQRLLEQPEPSSVFAIGAQVVPELVGPCIAEIIPLEELEGAYSDLRTTNQTSPNPSPLREVHRLLRNCGEEKDGWA
ncbi:MAG: hypothetical protein FJY66_03915, partial [Calditrichaeota bacterium]|nr:hypothetical protein [Calditrichota bacterium]